MLFGEAMTHIGLGRRLTRTGWNGPNQYIYKAEIEGYAPFIAMKTTSGTIQAGWLATQGDFFAEDWEVVDERTA